MGTNCKTRSQRTPLLPLRGGTHMGQLPNRWKNPHYPPNSISPLPQTLASQTTLTPKESHTHFFHLRPTSISPCHQITSDTLNFTHQSTARTYPTTTPILIQSNGHHHQPRKANGSYDTNKPYYLQTTTHPGSHKPPTQLANQNKRQHKTTPPPFQAHNHTTTSTLPTEPQLLASFN